MGKIDRNSKVEFVALGKMHVSELSQRELRPSRVDTLVSEFDINRLGWPVLNKRGDSYYILDGQHRVAALRKWNGSGWEQIQIECQVFQGLTETEEAEMFLRLNDVLPVGVFDKFSKAIAAKRLMETAVKATVEAQGLTISQHRTPGAIPAVGTLMRVFKRSDGQTLGCALRIVRDSYGDPGLEAAVIDGMAHLCQRYNGVLNEKAAIERLGAARGGVKGLVNRANALYLRTGNSKPLCVAAAAVDIINSGRGKHMLPSWWKTENT